MAKLHKLTGAEARTWRANVPYVVDGEGNPQRILSTEEEAAVCALIEQAKRHRAPQSQELEIFDSEENPQKVTITVEVYGNSQSPHTAVFIDSLRRMTAREIMGERFLKQYKRDVMLQTPGGKFLKMVRHPDIERPKTSDAMRTVPAAKYCACKDWGNPHPGRHHPACEHNKHAPPEEQAESDTDTRLSEADIAALPAPKDKSVVSDLIVEAPGAQPVHENKAPAPEMCWCAKWHGTEKGKHHALCQNRMQYEREQGQVTATQEPEEWLVELDGGEAVRPATREEVEQSKQAQIETGLASVEVEGKRYAVSVLEDGNEDANDTIV